METYKVVYEERIIHCFYIEADSEDGAMEEFERLSFNAELDLSDGELVEGNVVSIEKENYHEN